VFSVAYAGSNGLHLYDIANVNPIGGGPTYLGDPSTNANQRLNFQYGNMNFRSDNGYSHYDALNVRYGGTNFFNKGLGFTANYTWSHALDNLSSTFSDTNGATQSGFYQLGYIDAFNPKLNYGNADFDIRHRLNLSATWEVPWMKTSNNAIARNVLGGWGLGTIVSVRSGSPFSIYDCNNASQTACPLWATSAAIPRTGSSIAQGGNLFNYIALPFTQVTVAPTATKPGSVTNNVNDQGVSLSMPNCTGLDHVGCTYTATGASYPERNQFFGPNFWNLDLNFYKSFKLTERFGLQFRGEFYNILNHHNQYVTTENIDVSGLSPSCNFVAPATTCNPGAIPAIQTEKGGPIGVAGQPADERRNIQFGLKLTF